VLGSFASVVAAADHVVVEALFGPEHAEHLLGGDGVGALLVELLLGLSLFGLDFSQL
jgi:hypothetical protein